jgi:hypothetical protein
MFYAIAAVEIGTIVLLIVGIIGLNRTTREIEGALLISYLVTLVLVPPVAVLWGVAEKSRWGTGVVLIGMWTVVPLENWRDGTWSCGMATPCASLMIGRLYRPSVGCTTKAPVAYGGLRVMEAGTGRAAPPPSGVGGFIGRATRSVNPYEYARGIKETLTDPVGTASNILSMPVNLAGQAVDTLYGHMTYGSRQVSAGQYVEAGQMIGLVGSTGSSTACHVHFEVHINGGVVDPWGSAEYSPTWTPAAPW